MRIGLLSAFNDSTKANDEAAKDLPNKNPKVVRSWLDEGVGKA